ncbi:MAG: membrane-bound lytic murein transglycosylase MltF [endosymbiont of Galathealinum brachiosum]|uniref:Membrane-bound lytic murein transglycosylase F n=1 Tax=endosymbiont of Galathealinum brachiosum TaxID=2200906 RepID=A0A370DJR7_9GAMM|nr:MAG: membrane-bound lytic murein transglycosylase MltF [endosymbiont of Galathealinum brachiosum]
MANPLQSSRCRLLGLSLILLISVILMMFKVVPLLFKPNTLNQVLESGELIIVTRNSSTTYYEGPNGKTGFEYELAKRFADSLGVTLKVITSDNLHEIFDMLNTGKAHFAAAGLTITDSRKEFVRFAASYMDITEQLIYNNQSYRPRKVPDLENGILEVIDGSSHVESLNELKTKNPELSWNTHSDIDSEQLLYLVENQLIDYTVADSNEVSLNQRFLLELRVAFDISEPKKLAWAFPKAKDTTLYDKAMSFFWRNLNDGEITHLIEKHYGHVTKFDYVGNRIFTRHIATRLSKYLDMYHESADKYNLDWKLLAAMGYQESHWNPKAVSPTGVRGIMMLTQHTAGLLGVKNRLDPKSSIFGGAKYLDQIRRRFPDELKEPDRTWYAMAAYNVGYYHVIDAQIIAKQQGKDPNKWVDLQTTLPLLARKKWYKKTKYGYARGWEPVKYVTNIRRYYDLLQYQFAPQDEEEEKGAGHDAFSIMPSVM